MKVAIAGTNGLAVALASRLQHTYHSCILLTRQQFHPLSSQFSITVVDYSDEAQLIYALSGIDIVFSMVTGTDQLLLIDAALKAHVDRFCPAEYSSLPESRYMRPSIDRGRRLARMRLRDHVDEGMAHTVIMCGLLYERLGPGGLQGIRMGGASGANAEGDFLVNFDTRLAQVPYDKSGRPSTVCMTALDDVARFIVAALDNSDWPSEFRLAGERMPITDVINLVREIRGGPELTLEQHSSEELRTRLSNSHPGSYEEQQISVLLAISEGYYDFPYANLNRVVNLRPVPFRTWLRQVWGATHAPTSENAGRS